MLRQYYEVVEEFDSKKDYGIEMRKQYTDYRCKWQTIRIEEDI